MAETPASFATSSIRASRRMATGGVIAWPLPEERSTGTRWSLFGPRSNALPARLIFISVLGIQTRQLADLRPDSGSLPSAAFQNMLSITYDAPSVGAIKRDHKKRPGEICLDPLSPISSAPENPTLYLHGRA